jgi:hypothetical protein
MTGIIGSFFRIQLRRLRDQSVIDFGNFRQEIAARHHQVFDANASAGACGDFMRRADIKIC